MRWSRDLNSSNDQKRIKSNHTISLITVTLTHLSNRIDRSKKEVILRCWYQFDDPSRCDWPTASYRIILLSNKPEDILLKPPKNENAPVTVPMSFRNRQMDLFCVRVGALLNRPVIARSIIVRWSVVVQTSKCGGNANHQFKTVSLWFDRIDRQT